VLKIERVGTNDTYRAIAALLSRLRLEYTQWKTCFPQSLKDTDKSRFAFPLCDSVCSVVKRF